MQPLSGWEELCEAETCPGPSGERSRDRPAWERYRDQLRPSSICDVPCLAPSRLLASCVTSSRTPSLSPRGATPAHGGGGAAGATDP